MGLIKKPCEIAPKNTMSILIYGQPGVGKSTLACSAPVPVLFDFDGGVNRINGAHQVPTIQVTSWTEVSEALAEIDREMPECQSIIVDTCGKMLDFIAAYIMEDNPKMRKADGTLSLQGYGIRRNIFVNFIKQIAVSGRNAIFVAHEREEKRGDDTFKRPEIGGSSAGDLIKELDLVGYMSAIGKERGISYDVNEFFYAKNSCSLQPTKLPVLLDETGNTTASNTYLTEVVEAFRYNQIQNLARTKEYAELIAKASKAIAEAEDADDLNNVVDYLKGLTHIYDSKIKLARMVNDRAVAMNLKLDKKTKLYVSKA